jgi:predicted nucleic-acid-binding Zn-ribbon protein
MIDNCEKCGSDKIIPNAKAIDRDGGGDGNLLVSVDEKPDAFVFKQRIRSSVSAKICGDCGFIEFYADEPQSLYSAYINQEPRLKLVK